MIKFKSGFELAKFSDLCYEKMTVELRFNGVPFAQVNKDKEEMEVEFPSRFSPENCYFRFNIEDLLEALNAAREILKDL